MSKGMSWSWSHRLLALSRRDSSRLAPSVFGTPLLFNNEHKFQRFTTLSSPLCASGKAKEDEEDPWKKERWSRKGGDDAKALVTRGLFDNLDDKSRDTFLMAIDVFIDKDKQGRGHVEFILSALNHMKDFGVHRDLAAYKKIIDVFPKGKFIATNMWQVEFMHFPKQQECGIAVLEQMETMGVIPDSEVEVAMVNIFGNHAFPLRKLRRMLYWMPKFKNLSPWPVPDPLPDISLEIAKLAIQRITSVDLESKVTTYFPLEELEDSIDPTWIVSGQSAAQQKLIEEHPANQPVYVEGAFRVWLRHVCVNYFILRTAPKPVVQSTRDEDDVSSIPSMFTEEDYVENELTCVPSVHEQEDGVILGVCATGTSSLDSILSWIRFLERTNPRLGKDISVLFTLKSPLGPTDDLTPVTSQDLTSPDLLEGDDTEGSGPQSLVSSSGPSTLTSTSTFDLDPSNPQLEQVGIEHGSDSRFINWPHHFSKEGLGRGTK